MSNRWINYIMQRSPKRGSEYVVLLVLADQANDEGLCWPGLDLIARYARLSTKQTKRILQKLAAEGFVSQTSKGGGRGHPAYWLLHEKGDIVMTPFVATQAVGQLNRDIAMSSFTANGAGHHDDDSRKGDAMMSPFTPEPVSLKGDISARNRDILNGKGDVSVIRVDDPDDPTDPEEEEELGPPAQKEAPLTDFQRIEQRWRETFGDAAMTPYQEEEFEKLLKKCSLEAIFHGIEAFAKKGKMFGYLVTCALNYRPPTIEAQRPYTVHAPAPKPAPAPSVGERWARIAPPVTPPAPSAPPPAPPPPPSMPQFIVAPEPAPSPDDPEAVWQEVLPELLMATSGLAHEALKDSHLRANGIVQDEHRYLVLVHAQLNELQWLDRQLKPLVRKSLRSRFKHTKPDWIEFDHADSLTHSHSQATPVVKENSHAIPLLVQ